MRHSVGLDPTGTNGPKRVNLYTEYKVKWLCRVRVLIVPFCFNFTKTLRSGS